MREDVRVSSAVSKAVDETGAVEKVGVVVNEVRRVLKEASQSIKRRDDKPIHFFDRIYGTFSAEHTKGLGVR